VIALVMKQGVQATIVGVIVGLAGAFGVNRLMTSLLFGVQPTDAATMAAVIATITIVATIACWLPAWRASQWIRMSCSEPTKHRDSLELDIAKDIDAPTSRKSSIFLRRMIGSIFMRVNSQCAHQLRPPLSRHRRAAQASVHPSRPQE